MPTVKWFFSVCAFHVFIDSVDHGRGKFFATQSVSSAGNYNVFSSRFVECGYYVEIERFACATAFFYSVENCYSLDALRKRVCKHIASERTVKSYFEYAVLSAFCVEIVYGFAYRFRAATHYYYYGFSVRRAVILIRFVFATGNILDVFHCFRNDFGNSLIVLVARFAVLEVYIRVLSGAFLNGMLGIERTLFEFVYVASVFLIYDFFISA